MLNAKIYLIGDIYINTAVPSTLSYTAEYIEMPSINSHHTLISLPMRITKISSTMINRLHHY